MEIFSYKGKTYRIDASGFLLDHSQWDEDFAEAMASRVQITEGLSKEHRNVIHFIRKSFEQTGVCPSVYQTCKANGLSYRDLQRLFPTGHLRGACKLAGVTYREGFTDYFHQYGAGALFAGNSEEERLQRGEKVYRVDVRGFLVDPVEWDENFAIHRAHEMKIPRGLSERHWMIINFLRDCFEKNRVVPTFAETCEANRIELDELHELFPDGYHRGAVKIAGLRVR